ncbi:hypothetical protein [Spirosoma rhododendri]|uniref:Uncharacterized protein n=1 Tax=Spirosoma rhododendri TaxID=2728024 RepID=A0A7L5DRK5_9BACT|nr:hypothetical protein [Spirosoma rhododendri]QJD80232.1 hypothetical protein HH216_18765 [Spirosoma rhododendri]
MIRLLLIGLPILLWACQPEDSSRNTTTPSTADRDTAGPVNDFRIVPGQRAGLIHYSTSESELLRLLGASVVTTGDTVYGAEGEVFIGTTLYKGTADEAQILYRDSSQRQHPELVLIRPTLTDIDGNLLPNPKPTRWTTADGLRIGTTLHELERRNGKPFRLWGFGWDYGGNVSDWQGGRLEKGGRSLLAMTLGPPPTMTSAQQKDYEAVMGDGEFMSSLAPLQRLDPVVQVMQVTLEP